MRGFLVSKFSFRSSPVNNIEKRKSSDEFINYKTISDLLTLPKITKISFAHFFLLHVRVIVCFLDVPLDE